jgi:hypothetical protein
MPEVPIEQRLFASPISATLELRRRGAAVLNGACTRWRLPSGAVVNVVQQGDSWRIAFG